MVALSHWLVSRGDSASSVSIIGRSASRRVARSSSRARVLRSPASRHRCKASAKASLIAEMIH